jgi:uncharacterized protein YbbK (DUF523 family)/uncharacterized protein YbgA (DUF1722 family)
MNAADRTFPQRRAAGRPIRIGISQCLLGEEVRYDGGHKRDPFLTDVLSAFVEFVPVCPEVELGMGIPREPVRLEGDAASPRMVGTRSRADHTPAMTAFAARRVRALDEVDLCGYVLKKNSPSCGMERVKVYGGSGAPAKRGMGLYARALMERFPLLPVEEEGRLHDPVLRENFIERVFAYRRWKDFLAERYSIGRLVAFHTAHKFLILSHSPTHYTEMGRIVAGAKRLGPAGARGAYGRAFMEGMARRTTLRKHTNVLQHMAGFLKRGLDPASRGELARVIEDYRKGLVPLVVPVTLLRHHARSVGQEYLLGQVYLDPHPKELMLRNHV